mmetsp:Transcript_30389/g.59709  ORF Transcript_30389/g.59709 Transcript_30389/m.59709 type:complete len:103 (-) Transcript_30389:263-571(-)
MIAPSFFLPVFFSCGNLLSHLQSSLHSFFFFFSLPSSQPPKSGFPMISSYLEKQDSQDAERHCKRTNYPKLQPPQYTVSFFLTPYPSSSQNKFPKTQSPQIH